MTDELRNETKESMVWVATVEQDIGDPVIMLADTRDTAKARAEKFAATTDAIIEEWLESPYDDSLMGHVSDGRNAIVRSRTVKTEVS